MRKDGGIKLLPINEQPLGYAQAKKRKKMLELEEQQKKVAEAQAAAAAAASASAVSPVVDTPVTPEYAQGLAPINPPATPVAPVATAQSYVAPSTPTSIVVTTTPTTRKIKIQSCNFSIRAKIFILKKNSHLNRKIGNRKAKVNQTTSHW